MILNILQMIDFTTKIFKKIYLYNKDYIHKDVK